MNAAFLLAPAVGGAAFRAAKTAVNALDGAGDVARSVGKFDDLAEAAKGFSKLDEIGDPVAKGGVYRLKDPVTGEVMRTGRSNNLARRAAQHARDPNLKKYKFDIVFKSDVKAEQRGLEQVAHQVYSPPLDRINAVAANNRNIDAYVVAAQDFLTRYGVIG